MISYTVDGPYAVTDGDIIVGRAGEFENWRHSRQRGEAVEEPQSVHQIFGTSGPQLWPNGILYYTIDPSVTNIRPILDGIAQWNSMTPLQVLPRTDQPDYVRFTSVSIDAACESYVGKLGGPQDIGMTSACTAGSVAHELGHAFGLLHEHQRSDRGGSVTVLYQNIDKRFYSDFYQSPSGYASSGYYDFGSIMQYPYYGFSSNFQDTLESVPVGIAIGQRLKLSAGDIDGASRLYGIIPATTTITTVPEGLPVIVDGVETSTPQSFSWSPDSQHTIEVAPSTGIDPLYVFANWSDSGAASHTITASSDQTVFCANFVTEHLFNVSVLGRRGGTVSVAPLPQNGYLPERYPFNATAAPADAFQFVGWTGFGLYNLYDSGEGASLPSALAEVSSQSVQGLAASFTNQPITIIDSQPRGVLVNVDGISYYTPQNFAWGNGTTHTLFVASPQYSGNNTTRYQFTGWEDGSTGSRIVTAGPSGGAYSASFNTQYRLSAETLTVGSVTASPSSPDGFYDSGTPVQLTATTGPYTLRYWVGDLSSNDNPATVVMDQPRVVNANIGTALPFRVLSAASLTGNPNIGSTGTFVAPGELVALFGSNIGPANPIFAALDENGKFPTSLGGYQVLFDSSPAPLVYAGPNQINAIVPSSVNGQTSTGVRIQGRTPSLFSSMSVSATAPGLFTSSGYGTGNVSAINQDGTVNSPSNPAPRGSVVVLYGTGGGLMDRTFDDGAITGSDLGHISAPVWARFGKLPANIYYAGNAPYLVNGVFQINVTVPADLPTGGEIPIQVIMGNFASPPGTTISVQ